MPITISDIAKMANVSQSTVSRVLNNSGYVKDDTGKPLPGVRLNIGQLQSPTLIGSDGYYEQKVPANTKFNIILLL